MKYLIALVFLTGCTQSTRFAHDEWNIACTAFEVVTERRCVDKQFDMNNPIHPANPMNPIYHSSHNDCEMKDVEVEVCLEYTVTRKNRYSRGVPAKPNPEEDTNGNVYETVLERQRQSNET